MARAFVTGGSGFLGRNLIRALVARGDEVVALVRSEKAAATVRAIGSTPVLGELHERASYEGAMRGADVVFHAAAKVEEWGDPADFRRVNVEGTESVLAAARAQKVPTLVHVSTESVLLGGKKLRRADETFPYPEGSLGLYPGTKRIAEQRVLAANGPELRTVVVRPRFIWGEGDTALLPKLVEAVENGRFSFIDHGDYLTSTCHVANVVEGMLLAAEKGRGGEVYFLTDGEDVRFADFLRRLLGTRGVDPGTKSVPFGVAHLLARVCTFLWSTARAKNPPPISHFTVHVIGEEVTVSDAKARRELGYVGKVTRDEGLRAMSAAA